jgi:hypothetical protein
MACFLGEEKIVAQRSAQVVGNLGRAQPEMLRPWWSEMADACEAPIHDAIRRNAARYFSELEIQLPKPLEKLLVKIFTEWAMDPDLPVGIAVFAMQFVADRAKRFPEEAETIKTVIISRLPNGTPGFCNRGNKILKQLA